MTNRVPPQLTPLAPNRPFQSEAEWSKEKANTWERQKKANGALPDQPPDAPVKNDMPFRNLKSR